MDKLKERILYDLNEVYRIVVIYNRSVPDSVYRRRLTGLEMDLKNNKKVQDLDLIISDGFEFSDRYNTSCIKAMENYIRDIITIFNTDLLRLKEIYRKEEDEKTKMARSKFKWMIVFETLDTQIVVAQSVYQIMNNPHVLVSDIESIISINRIELDNGEYGDISNVADIPFQN